MEIPGEFQGNREVGEISIKIWPDWWFVLETPDRSMMFFQEISFCFKASCENFLCQKKCMLLYFDAVSFYRQLAFGERCWQSWFGDEWWWIPSPFLPSWFKWKIALNERKLPCRDPTHFPLKHDGGKRNKKSEHPAKLTAGTQFHGGLVQMVFLCKWVISRFQPLIFRGWIQCWDLNRIRRSCIGYVRAFQCRGATIYSCQWWKPMNLGVGICFVWCYLGVSKNRGTPKSSICS